MNSDIVTFAKSQFRDPTKWPGDKIFQWQEKVRRLALCYTSVNQEGGLPEILAIDVLKEELNDPDIPQEFREKVNQVVNVQTLTKSVMGWPWFEEHAYPVWIPEEKLKITNVIPERFTFHDGELYLQVKYEIEEYGIDPVFQQNKESSHIPLADSESCLFSSTEQEAIVNWLDIWLEKINLECIGCCKSFYHLNTPFRQVIVAIFKSDSLSKFLSMIEPIFKIGKIVTSYHLPVYVDYREPYSSDD